MEQSQPQTPPSESAGSAQDQQFLSCLCRHLVGVCWKSRDVDFDGEEWGEPRALCATAAVVEWNSRWYLITAGHVVNLIQTTARDLAQRITKATLFNAWASDGLLTQTPLPIDLCSIKAHVKEDRGEGVDVGMVCLGKEHVRVLRERGTVPLLQNHIGVPDGQSVEQYWLLGIPKELQTLLSAGCLEIEPNVFRVFLCNNPGCFLDTDQPRFYARVPPEVSLEDLNGMSGGPIFAFTLSPSGYEVWIAGVQSGWNSEYRTIVATPTGVYLDELRRWVKEQDNGDE